MNSHDQIITKSPRTRTGYAWLLPLIYGSWLAMMAVHESGHVLHAWISGGQVSAVHFGLFEFSETELAFNPHPQFVAWGGPIWGCLFPFIAYELSVVLLTKRVQRILSFFAGFCLIVNGAYIGIGWIDGAGDAGTLLRHGAPAWVLCVGGLGAMAGGLCLWHRLSERRVLNAS